MRYNRASLRYSFLDSKSQRPLLADDKQKKKDVPKDPRKKDDFPDQDDDDLKNVDQSKGGYGHGSGFDKEY